jgi:SAM-dependent methyltransferase
MRSNGSGRPGGGAHGELARGEHGPCEALALTGRVPDAQGNGQPAAQAPGSDPLLAALEGRRSWLVVRREYRHLRMASSLLIDKLLGVDTTPREAHLALGSTAPSDLQHRPTGWLTLWRIFRQLRTIDDGAVLDVGSGAGRAVLVASTFPFRRVIGLEALEPLHRLANDNLERFRLARQADVQLVLGDATRYELPDDVTAIFLYNPFAGSAFAEWTERVFTSLDRSPRRLTIAYVNPVEHEYLMQTGRCRLLGRFRGWRPSDKWARMLGSSDRLLVG